LQRVYQLPRPAAARDRADERRVIVERFEVARPQHAAQTTLKLRAAACAFPGVFTRDAAFAQAPLFGEAAHELPSGLALSLDEQPAGRDECDGRYDSHAPPSC